MYEVLSIFLELRLISADREPLLLPAGNFTPILFKRLIPAYWEPSPTFRLGLILAHRELALPS